MHTIQQEHNMEERENGVRLKKKNVKRNTKYIFLERICQKADGLNSIETTMRKTLTKFSFL